MDDEKIERQMAFIIEQQARFSTDMIRLEEQTKMNNESIRQNTESIGQNTRHIGNLADALMRLTNIVEKRDQQIAELIEQNKATGERMKETDARLNVLIAVVERHISDSN